jgi:DNA-directed RNA polymerase subunit A'
LKARISDDADTIGLNPGVIAPFNADFDGDEMSIYGLADDKSRAEAERLATPRANALNFKDGSVVFGPSQDAMTGLHVLSLDETRVDPTCLTKRVRLLSGCSGKAFVSAMLPEDFDYFSDEIEIRSGIFARGVLTKSNFWTKKDSVLSSYVDKYGKERLIEFLTRIQKEVLGWILKRGLSVSLEDCRGPEISEEPEAAGERRLGAYKIFTEEKSFESCRGGLKEMVSAQTKGDRNNVGQIMACVGYQGDQEKLPHFDDDDRSPAAVGFVRSSYASGLNPAEMFYHSRTGREGMIRTGISTAETGYAQRSIVKFSEGLTVRGDDTVRDCDDTIVSFRYGNDPVDLSKRDEISAEFLSA